MSYYKEADLLVMLITALSMFMYDIVLLFVIMFTHYLLEAMCLYQEK